MTSLRPFWCYYGGKWRAAPRYPEPRHGHIVEPFAGAAGYALRYAHLRVTLVERYAVVAEMWRWLIGASRDDVLRVPVVDDVRSLPGNTPDGARALVGFHMNIATVSPCVSLSKGIRRLRSNSRRMAGWTEERRAMTAEQVQAIRHWRIIEGDYTDAPDVEATWFVDPPYANRAGSYYVHADVDHVALGSWCREREGQVIVCENEGATWLPFEPFATLKAGINGSGSREVMWTNRPPRVSLPLLGWVCK